MNRKFYPVFFVVYLLCISNFVIAQEKLWGVAPSGGQYQNGTVFNLNPDGSDLNVYYNFYDPEFPFGVNDQKKTIIDDLLFSSRGYLQGVMKRDGYQSFLFQVAADGSELRRLFEFPKHPVGELVEVDGSLFGLTEDNTLFKIGADGIGYTELYSLGIGEIFGLYKGPGKVIYGVAREGGSGDGFIFSYDTQQNQYHIVHTFSGYHYSSGLTVAPDGDIYGSGVMGTRKVIFHIPSNGEYDAILYEYGGGSASEQSKIVYFPEGYLFVYNYVGDSFSGNFLKIKTDGSGTLPLDDYEPGDEIYYEDEDLKIYITHEYGDNESISTAYLTDAEDHILTGLTHEVVVDNTGKGYVFVGPDAQFIYSRGYLYDGIVRITPSYNVVASTAEFFLGNQPNGALVHTDEGELIGANFWTGSYGGGTIFKVGNEGMEKVHQFPFLVNERVEGNGMGYYSGWVYATVPKGGSTKWPSNGPGAISRMRPDGSEYKEIHKFDYKNGLYPFGKVIAADDYLYGMTTAGGANGNGIIYRMRADGSDFINLYNFNKPTGKNPYGHLIELPDGYLYGLTSSGGIGNVGAIFKVSKDGSDYVKLHDFTIPQGSTPYGSLIYDPATELLYGMTSKGGTYRKGIIFSIGSDGSGFNILRSLNDGDGIYPKGDLVMDAEGYLYGVATEGGNNGLGTIFKIKNDGSGFTKLVEGSTTTGGFSHAEGFPSFPTLAFVSPGALKFDTYVTSPADSAQQVASDATLTIKTVYDQPLTYTIEISSSPEFDSPIILSGNGPQYMVEELQPATRYFTRVKTNLSGYGPVTTFTTHSVDPLLWGVTSTGGGFNAGTVFSIRPDGSGFMKYYDYKHTQSSFCEAYLHGNLMQRTDGSVIGYSVSPKDASDGDCGEIFAINPDGSDYRIIYSVYSTPPGGMGMPFGGLMQASNGLFYYVDRHTNLWRGAIRSIEFDETGNNTNFLKEFTQFNEGWRPSAPMTEVSNGYLYGMMPNAGSNNGNGIIYRIGLDGTGYQKIHEFDKPMGKNPEGSLIEGEDGYLYGMTSSGGSANYGAIFKILPDGSQYTKLHDFNIHNGRRPLGDLVEADGVLYGMTSSGGAHKSGVVFKINTDGTGYMILHHFNGTDGATPLSSLIVYNNQLYGMTSKGGTYDLGVIFSIRSDGSGFTNLFNFAPYAGGNPDGALLLIDPSVPAVPVFAGTSVATVEVSDFETIIYPNPSTEGFSVHVQTPLDEEILYSITDLHGAIMAEEKAASNRMFNVGENLLQGVYILRIRKGDDVTIRRLIKK